MYIQQLVRLTTVPFTVIGLSTFGGIVPVLEPNPHGSRMKLKSLFG